MACASCGGGRQLSPNRPIQKPVQPQQAERHIFINRAAGAGQKQQMTPNQPKSKRTQV